MADQFFGITDTGKERQNNEDTFIAQQGENNKFIIACVIDGVGGYSGGEIAAAIAREAILQRLEKPSGEITSMIIDCFRLANEKIWHEKQQVKEHDSMACVSTLAIVDIAHNQFYYAHVGDTRLYLLRDNSLVKISHDQSFVGFLEDSGRLTEEAAMHHPKRNEINKALGFESLISSNSDYIETGQSPFLSGDMLLLCSDGLTDMVDRAEITSIIIGEGSLKDKCQKLVNAANAHGGKDNITVVLVQNNNTPLKHDATMPAANSKKNNNSENDNLAAPQKSGAFDRRLPGTATKSNKSLIIILFLLMLVFFASTIWLYLQSGQVVQKNAVAPVKKSRNKQEIKLQQAIDQLNGHVLILSDTAYTAPILISEAIRINKDSLLIKARGKIVLQSDSGYTGPALSLSQKCKSVVLDSLSVNNFRVGIAAYNSALTLKNIRFVNCPMPLQNAFTFADKKYMSGKLPVILFRTDSVPMIKK
ncbi:MAG: stp [Mucilaginibacter sp.]|nr:stp [Mucilaginibacter sp.]